MNELNRNIVTLDDLERRAINAHIKPYYDWIRHVVSLSIMSLTAQISLQGQYLPKHPQAIYFLAFGWLALLSTILLGVLALRAEYTTHLASADRIRKMRIGHGDACAANDIMAGTGTNPHWSHRWYVLIMVCSFVISLASLCIFAIVNLLANNA